MNASAKLIGSGLGAPAMADGSYDRITIALHWSTAALVAVLWVIGQTADWIPDGPLNTDL